MAATMKDIARVTGLGLATISSYLNGGNVREQNRVKIEQAIEDLHYEVNEVARGLRTQATRTVGVVIPELNNVFCSQIITGMEDALRSEGYATIVCDCRSDTGLEKEAIDFLVRKRVDGLVIVPTDIQGRNLREFLKSEKPLILIDRRIQGIHCDSVLVDNRSAASEAVLHLIKKGHRNIGIIGGPRDVFTSQERLDGYAAAHRMAGIPVQESLIMHGDYTIRSGARGIQKLISRNPHMTAVFVTNYEMTMGAVIGLNELSLKFPQDISIVGFDNLEFARACSPSLTIVSQPTVEIGEKAAEIMLCRLSSSGQDEEPKIIRLGTKLIEGRSVADISD
ncbi:MAG: LacI family DNA-binding transcriptional regulator [Blautia sp.]|nr:LacI family DNA-binding transcriptional regulator [Blautia sp.]